MKIVYINMYSGQRILSNMQGQYSSKKNKRQSAETWTIILPTTFKPWHTDTMHHIHVLGLSSGFQLTPISRRSSASSFLASRMIISAASYSVKPFCPVTQIQRRLRSSSLSHSASSSAFFLLQEQPQNHVSHQNLLQAMSATNTTPIAIPFCSQTGANDCLA